MLGAATLNAVPIRRITLPGGWLYFAVIAIAPAAMYFGVASSMTLGVTLICGLLVARRLPRNAATLSLVVVVAAGLHLAAAMFIGSVDLMRAVGSMFPLALLVAAGGALARELRELNDKALHRSLIGCFWLMCALMTVALTGLAPLNLLEWRRPVFPFPEPSNFAIAFVPMLLYACVTAKKTTARLFLLAIGLLLTALIQNLTLGVGCFLVALVTLRWRYVLLAAGPLAIVLTLLDLSYYTGRLNLSEDSQNVSSLAYLQGWQMIFESMQRSEGFGLGFQQLGIQGTEVAASEVLRGMREGEDMNLLDGTFVFSKLASDFGVFGILLVVAYAGLVVRGVRVLRRMVNDRLALSPVVCLAYCVVVSYVLELFVRGAGYFTGGSLLFVFGLWILFDARDVHAPAPSQTALGHGTK